MPGRKNDNNRNNRRDYDDSYEYMQRSSGNRSGNGRQDNRFQDVSSYSSQDEYNSRRKNKKGSTVVKSVAAIVCSLLIIAGAALIFLSTYVFKDLTTQSMPVDPVELGINSSVVSDDKIKNIALFGLDARNESFEGRSDAIMIVSLDSRHNKIKLTSILRDSLVDIEGNGKDKITHAYVYGGYTLAVKTLNQNYNLDITDYATVNFYKMAEIVDAFGGTTVTITDDERVEINNNLDLLVFDDPYANVSEDDYIYESGEVTLNGNQAVAYSRIRNVGNDEERAVRQQNVIKGLISSMKQMNPGDYVNMAKTIMGLCETSIGLSDITSLTPIISGASIETLSIPDAAENAHSGESDLGGWVWEYDLERAGQHIDAFIKEDSSPYYNEYYGGNS